MESRTPDAELNRMLEAGAAMEAFERFYADEVTMQENLTPPRNGKAANRAACQAHLDAVRDLRMTLLGAASAGDLSFSEWRQDYRTPAGDPVEHHEVAVRRWRDGKVVAERFYYPE